MRGSGEGVGVHLLTGPVAVENAEPGDILEVRILDVRPRPSCNACHAGRCFGSNAAATLGLSLSRPDRGAEAARGHHDLRARYLRRAVRQGGLQLCLDAADRSRTASCIRPSIIPACGSITAIVRKRENILPNVKVPARLHFGTMGLAPSESDFVSSIPPSYTGGNIDDWRIGKGARMYYPVAVPGALFLGRRSACGAGRQRTRRHRDRDLADRRLRIHPAQEPRSRRHRAGRA